MNFEERTKEFLIKQYERAFVKKLETDGIHTHVLKNKEDNFFLYNNQLLKRTQFHRWAGSLKSSQAMAYNLFSKLDSATFEYALPALDSKAPAILDVKITCHSGKLIKLYEVKMMEFTTNSKIDFSNRYFDPKEYGDTREIYANEFVAFLREVRHHFKERTVYGSGVKQLCCHLLGIVKHCLYNEPEENVKYKLYSMCFDGWADAKFQEKLHSYKKVLDEFQVLVNAFIKKVSLDEKVEYLGFVGTNSFISGCKDNIYKECIIRYVS